MAILDEQVHVSGGLNVSGGQLQFVPTSIYPTVVAPLHIDFATTSSYVVVDLSAYPSTRMDLTLSDGPAGNYIVEVIHPAGFGVDVKFPLNNLSYAKDSPRTLSSVGGKRDIIKLMSVENQWLVTIAKGY